MRIQTIVLLATALVTMAATAVTPASASEPERVGSYNTQHLGPVGAPAWEDLVSVLIRVDAQLVCLQEIDSSDRSRMPQLAQDAGYPYHSVAETSGTLSGYLRNAAMSRRPISQSQSWSAAELSGDPSANDITRDIFTVWIEIEPGLANWAVIVVHLKAGTSDTDKFRRQVEIRRLVQAVDKAREESPGSPVVVLGDFNEDPRNGPFGSPVFDQLPPDLPMTYQLGNDISFPVTYDPFVTLEAEGLVQLDAFHEDDPLNPVTHPATDRILDLLFIDQHLSAQGTEIYESCDDNGVDDPPPGYWLPKKGDPLACGISEGASDHLELFGELLLVPVDQDSDGVDDAIDCAPLDSQAGQPPEIGPVEAETTLTGDTRYFWPAAATADRYDVIRGDLGAPESGVCRSHLDPDATDTEFIEDGIPASSTGWHFLFRGIDEACGGEGPWGSESVGDGCP